MSKIARFANASVRFAAIQPVSQQKIAKIELNQRISDDAISHIVEFLTDQRAKAQFESQIGGIDHQTQREWHRGRLCAKASASRLA